MIFAPLRGQYYLAYRIYPPVLDTDFYTIGAINMHIAARCFLNLDTLCRATGEYYAAKDKQYVFHTSKIRESY
jgi:hypothetical protein